MTATTGDLEIIAEAAQGFEGNERLALLLVRAAQAGGADIVKFQLVYAEELATPDYAYFGLFKQLEMSDASWKLVAQAARDAGIGLVFDIFGERSLRLALELGAAGVKLHSTDFYNTRLVRAALERSPHVYLSAGGIEYDDIVRILDSYAIVPGRATLLFGFQGEPTSINDNHIARIPAIAARCPGLRLGFMDHADGSLDEAGWLGLLALPLGATVIEKHVTLHRALGLEDGVSALEPDEFALYSARLRAAKVALGSAALQLSPGETAYGQRSVKVLVATRDIAAGSRITEDDLIGLRAPMVEGLTPLRMMAEAVGQSAGQDLRAGTPVYKEWLR